MQDEPVEACREDGRLTGDAELVERAAAGDGAAFHLLVDRHGPELYRLAVWLGGRADAEDIVQETFLGAFKSLRKFAGRSSVKTWLKRILVRQAARRWGRWHRRSRPISLDALETADVSDNRKDRPSPATAIEQKLDLLSVLQTLSEEHRQVLVLREYEQMSYAQIAQALGLPQGTVESRLHRARAELRGKLSGYAD